MATRKQISYEQKFIINVGNLQYFARSLARLIFSEARKNHFLTADKLTGIKLLDQLEHKAYDEATVFLRKKNTGMITVNDVEPKTSIPKTTPVVHEFFTNLCKPEMLGSHTKVYAFLEKCMKDKIDELTPKPHVLVLMLQHAQDATLEQEPWRNWVYAIDQTNNWAECSSHPEWYETRKYRRKFTGAKRL